MSSSHFLKKGARIHVTAALSYCNSPTSHAGRLLGATGANGSPEPSCREVHIVLFLIHFGYSSESQDEQKVMRVGRHHRGALGFSMRHRCVAQVLARSKSRVKKPRRAVGRRTRRPENATPSDTVSNGREAIRSAFPPLLKCSQTGRKPAAKAQAIVEKWPDDCNR